MYQNSCLLGKTCQHTRTWAPTSSQRRGAPRTLSPPARRRLPLLQPAFNSHCNRIPGSLSTLGSGNRKSLLSLALPRALSEPQGNASPSNDVRQLLNELYKRLTSKVTWAWSTDKARLELTGTWDACPEAHRMAMLAVYQEWYAERAKLISWVLQYVAETYPGYLPSKDLQAVEEMRRVNLMSPEVECMGPQQLTQLAVAVLPMEACLDILAQLVGTMQQALLEQSSSSRGGASFEALLTALDLVHSSTTAGTLLAGMRLRIAPDLRWQQQQEAAARGGGPAPRPAQYTIPPGLLQPQGVRAMWTGQEAGGDQEVQELAPERVYYYYLEKLGGPNTGRVGNVSFRGAQGGRSAFYDLALRKDFAALQAALHSCENLQHALPPVGLTTDVVRLHRALLLDALCTYALSAPQRPPQPLPSTCQHRITVVNKESQNFRRSLSLHVSGLALPVLRGQCAARGPAFMEGFSPTVGNPFRNVQEWNYFREAAQVWTRFVITPPVETATVTFLDPLESSPAPSALPQPLGGSGVQVQLDGRGVVGFVAAVTEYLTGDLGFDQRNWFPVDSPLQLRRLPGPSGQTSQLQLRHKPQAGPEVQVTLGEAHLQSLVAIVDDLLLQLPSFMRLPFSPLHPPRPTKRGAILRQARMILAPAARVLISLTLCALPLAAMLRPQQRGPSPAEALGWGRAAIATILGQGGGSIGGEEPQPVAAEVGPVNAELGAEEMAAVCEAVRRKVEGEVWVVVPPETKFEDLFFVYQVVADRQGSVLGCSTTGPDSLALYRDLPLAGELRPQAFADAQQRYLKALRPGPEGIKGRAAANKLQQSYEPVEYRPIPEDGVVVLRLDLQLDPEQRTTYTKGDEVVEMAGTKAEVVPWQDEDSIGSWERKGALVHGSQQPSKGTFQGYVEGTATAAGGEGGEQQGLRVELSGSPQDGLQALLEAAQKLGAATTVQQAEGQTADGGPKQ